MAHLSGSQRLKSTLDRPNGHTCQGWATKAGRQPAEEGVANERLGGAGGGGGPPGGEKKKKTPHGNERNAAWLLEHWRQETPPCRSHGLDVDQVDRQRRPPLPQECGYLIVILNRSFQPALLEMPEQAGGWRSSGPPVCCAANGPKRRQSLARCPRSATAPPRRWALFWCSTAGRPPTGLGGRYPGLLGSCDPTCTKR